MTCPMPGNRSARVAAVSRARSTPAGQVVLFQEAAIPAWLSRWALRGDPWVVGRSWLPCSAGDCEMPAHQRPGLRAALRVEPRSDRPLEESEPQTRILSGNLLGVTLGGLVGRHHMPAPAQPAGPDAAGKRAAATGEFLFGAGGFCPSALPGCSTACPGAKLGSMARGGRVRVLLATGSRGFESPDTFQDPSSRRTAAIPPMQAATQRMPEAST